MLAGRQHNAFSIGGALTVHPFPIVPIVPGVSIVPVVPRVPIVPVYGFPKNNTALRLEKPNNARILKDDCRLIKTRL